MYHLPIITDFNGICYYGISVMVIEDHDVLVSLVVSEREGSRNIDVDLSIGFMWVHYCG